MRELTIYTLVLFVIAVVLIAINLAEAEPYKTEPMDRMPVTGCPHGDSIPMDMCEKFDDVEGKQEVVTDEPKQIIIKGGK